MITKNVGISQEPLSPTLNCIAYYKQQAVVCMYKKNSKTPKGIMKFLIQKKEFKETKVNRKSLNQKRNLKIPKRPTVIAKSEGQGRPQHN